MCAAGMRARPQQQQQQQTDEARQAWRATQVLRTCTTTTTKRRRKKGPKANWHARGSNPSRTVSESEARDTCAGREPSHMIMSQSDKKQWQVEIGGCRGLVLG